MNKFKKILLLMASTLLCTGVITSCGENDVEITSMTLSANENTVEVGKTLQLNVEIEPSDADVSYTFSSNNTNVATVNETGLVKGVSVGNVKITCALRNNAKTAEINLSVVEPNPYSNLNIEEYSDELTSTPYATAGLSGKEKYGLSNAGVVGVDKSNIKDVATIKNESEYSVVIKYDDITLDDVKTACGNTAVLNDHYVLTTMFKKAKDNSDGTKTILVKLPSRTLELGSEFCGGQAKHFYLNGLKNVTILGDNTTLILVAKDLDWKGYINVSDCENLIIKGISLDAKYPSTLTGTLKSIDVDNGKATVLVESQYNDLVKELIKKHVTLYEYLEFDRNTKAPVPYGNCFDQGSFKKYTITGDDSTGYTFEVEFNKTITQTRLNSAVILSFTEYGNDTAGVNVTSSNNVTLEDINMYHASGMGLVCSETTDLFVNKFNVMLKEGSKALMTATADAMHFDKCRGKVEVTNCIIENSHDDALNMKHGYWYKLTNATNEKNSEGKNVGKIKTSKLTGAITPVVGDKLAIYGENDFVSHNPEGGYYTITEISGDTNSWECVLDKRLSDTASWGSCRVTFITRAPKFKFANNIVRNKRNRGILVQVPDAIVENNTFENIGHGSIQAACAMDQFNECTLPQNLTIRNNKFINNISLTSQPMYGDVAVFAQCKDGVVAPQGTIFNTTIENNFFTSNGNSAIALRGTGDTKIKDNFFFECCARTISGEQYNSLIFAGNVSDCELDGNYNQYTLDKGMSGIVMADLTTKDDIDLKSTNYLIKFYSSSKSGENIDIDKLNKSITIDGDLSDWEGSNAYNIDIIGCSDAKSAEHDLSELEDHFKVNKMMMSHTDDGLVFGFDVFDNELNFVPGSFWTGDVIELFLSNKLDVPTSQMESYRNKAGVAQIALAPTWDASNYAEIAASRSNDSYVGKEAQLNVKFNVRSDGYTCEFLLPYSLFKEFKNSVTNGERIAIATIIADSARTKGDKSTKDYERIQVGNVPHFVENYKTKTEMMPLYLFK